MAASGEGSDIRIINEPLNGSSVFLAETGEGRTPPEIIMEWLCIHQLLKIEVNQYSPRS
jgi:hypothetical protein